MPGTQIDEEEREEQEQRPARAHDTTRQETISRLRFLADSPHPTSDTYKMADDFKKRQTEKQTQTEKKHIKNI